MYPTERPNVDYKAAVSFQKKDPFGLKLIKHILAFANGGGGTIVIGFREGQSGAHVPDAAMNADIAATYDPTVLIPAVNEAIRGHEGIALQIYKEPFGDMHYPVIVIEPFNQVPYFCAVDRLDENKRPILKQGALYIRSNEAASVELATPDDWLRLLEVAVTRRQDDLLTRFGALMRQMGLPGTPDLSAQVTQIREAFQVWIAEQRAKALELAQEGDRFLPGTYAFAYRPVKLLDHRTDADLLRAMRSAERHNTGWPMGLLPEGFRNSCDRYEAVDDGLRVVIGQHDPAKWHFDYWLLSHAGAFYLLRILDADLYAKDNAEARDDLTASTVVWRVAEALDHCVALYRALGVDGSEQVLFEAEFSGLQGRFVSEKDGRVFRKGPSSRDTNRFSLTASLDQLVADADGIVYDAVRNLLSSFRFFDVPKSFVTRELADYRVSDRSR